MKKLFPDIGELGWSMYLSFHCRWLKENTNDQVIIMTSPERACLYKGLVEEILPVPEKFKNSFKAHQTHQSCFGLHTGVKKGTISSSKLKQFFVPYLPEGYLIPDYFHMGCYSESRKKFYHHEVIRKPYGISTKISGKPEILIFPRHRDFIGDRNLPGEFYLDLIKTLCKKYPHIIIRTMGVKSGAYDITYSAKNYINTVKDNLSLQVLIDKCQVAVGAIGSQSAPPKITLLQGVPTYMIGHQQKRHQVTENWMKTKAGFYHVNGTRYSKINNRDCIDKIIRFFEPIVN